MTKPRPPLFLERESYRRRRVMDAARVLPVAGLLLFMLPLLWAPQDSPQSDTARGGIYLFAVWGGLIAAAGLLARRLGAETRTDPPKPPARADGRGLE